VLFGRGRTVLEESVTKLTHNGKKQSTVKCG